jgi:hypothetical protein
MLMNLYWFSGYSFVVYVQCLLFAFCIGINGEEGRMEINWVYFVNFLGFVLLGHKQPFTHSKIQHEKHVKL